jgi:hypothetical protein
MSVRLISYPPEGAASTRLWRERRDLRIGRSADSDWRLDHPSVSRDHARLVHDGRVWRVHDEGSKNGTFFEGSRVVTPVPLPGPAWLRFGDLHCEFAPLDEAAADRVEQRIASRRASAERLTGRVDALTELPDALSESLRAIVELADCERGFVMLAAGDGMRLRASHGLAAADLRSVAFPGSAGAAQRALRERAAVVIHDVGADLELGGRASVIGGGLRAVVCLPLLADGKPIGLAYADSRRPHATIDALELDLLRAFAERVALWVAARKVDAILLQLAANMPPAWNEPFALPASGAVA